MNGRSTCLAVALCLPLLLASGIARADAFGTKPEAKALVEKAAVFIKKNGSARALSEITAAADKQGTLIDRDLYIFAYDFKGKVVAHGANKKLIGKSLIDMQDTDGKYVIRDLIAAAAKGSGWVDYKWSHPETKKIHQKSAYVLKIDDDLWIGCGAYTKS
jgi:cytochrome c